MIAALALAAGLAAGVPEQAKPYLPILRQEVNSLWPTAQVAVLAAQVDHETACPIPTKCWNPRVEFNTSRERGAGFGQITQVFGRFDALGEMKARHKELYGWNWETTLYDPRYQLRALVLKNRDNYAQLSFATDVRERTAMMLVAYNAGLGGVFKDRALCRNTGGCDASRWYGGIETACTASKVPQKGYGLSFCDIRKRYPMDIQQNRAIRYEDWAKKIPGDAH